MQKKVTIASWNVNSINTRLQHVIEWIENNDIDIIMLQELKCEKEKFPYHAFECMPYNIVMHGQKSYNGVAILSKFPIEEEKNNFQHNNHHDDARFLEVSVTLPLIGSSKIICLYAPNGGEVGSDKFKKKLEFFDLFTQYIKTLKKNNEQLIIGGDFNIAKEEIDVYDPIIWQNQTCFTLDERKQMRTLLNNGLLDSYRLTNPKKQEFTWWNYRTKLDYQRGIRIDSILISPEISKYLISFEIQKEWRAKTKPSDHAPCLMHLSEQTNGL